MYSYSRKLYFQYDLDDLYESFLSFVYNLDSPEENSRLFRINKFEFQTIILSNRKYEKKSSVLVSSLQKTAIVDLNLFDTKILNELISFLDPKSTQVNLNRKSLIETLTNLLPNFTSKTSLPLTRDLDKKCHKCKKERPTGFIQTFFSSIAHESCTSCGKTFCKDCLKKSHKIPNL